MKKQSMYFKMVMSSLIRRRSRMVVALLAVAIGATILSGLITIYYDIPRQMGKEFRSYGANLILVPAGEQSSLNTAAMEKAASVFPADNIVGMAPYRYETVKINEQPFMAAGTDLAEVKKVSPYWYIAGQWPEGKDAVLLGQEVADLIRLSPGDTFTATGTDAQGENFSHDFTVAGIVQTGGAEEAFIFMSLADLEGIMGNRDEVDVVECSIAADEEALSSMAEQIGAHDPEVTPRLVKRVTQSEQTVLGKLQALVYLVTVVVLLLTMICVSTTMMAVVTERRKEIGLKKALGAANQSIVLEFLGEGLFLGGSGGVLGVLFGFLFAQSVSVNVFSRSISFQPLLIPVTLVVSIGITGLACLIPVRSATDIEPAIVLRGE
ncbi:ABC transporter permease [Candidatus Formimonas warabiya]|uniref:ABC transporter permease n=1 Tax=Formimonas warabiya TaxID=1761012 RepID=A0A3G1L244_FORW1|nr:ABC transporter permease [Candidatus Formimonas warabiya]ATW28863.1 ABC transporter permease [Candidatus Formimonas warabiya]